MSRSFASAASANAVAFASPALRQNFTFRTVQRGGVWSVTKNSVFYGDYLARADAIEGACSGARAVEVVGDSAQVLAGPGDAVIPHQRLHHK